VVWSLLVLVIYSVSYVSLKQNVVSGLIDNSIACTVDFRVTRVIYYALDFCTQDSAAGKVCFVLSSLWRLCMWRLAEFMRYMPSPVLRKWVTAGSGCGRRGW
jgi:hypothetical protein